MTRPNRLACRFSRLQQCYVGWGTTSARTLRTVLAALAAVAALAVAPTASAQLVDRSHDRATFTVPDDQVCGIDVITTVTFVDNEIERIAGSGFPLFQASGRGIVSWSNPTSGKSISNSFAGLGFKDLKVVDNGDGTITLTTQVSGLPEMLTTPGGGVVNMDVGLLVFVSVLDYNGTPTDVDDDVELSQTLMSESGPHPDFDSDFALFCQNVIAALT
jgi:hypothetical protein